MLYKLDFLGLMKNLIFSFLNIFFSSNINSIKFLQLILSFLLKFVFKFDGFIKKLGLKLVIYFKEILIKLFFFKVYIYIINKINLYINLNLLKYSKETFNLDHKGKLLLIFILLTKHNFILNFLLNLIKIFVNLYLDIPKNSDKTKP